MSTAGVFVVISGGRSSCSRQSNTTSNTKSIEVCKSITDITAAVSLVAAAVLLL